MQPADNPIFIVGLGGHARVVAGILIARGIRPAGFIDGTAEAPAPALHSPIFDIPVMGHLSRLAGIQSPHVIVAIGDNVARARVCEEVRQIAPSAILPPLIHPTAIFEHRARCEEAVQICAGAILCADVQIAAGTIINTAASVDHEGRIGHFSHISPGARLAGRVTVGDFTHVGIGATVIEKIHIGSHVIIGAGAVVIRDVPDHAKVVGNPARPIRTNATSSHAASGAPDGGSGDTGRTH